MKSSDGQVSRTVFLQSWLLHQLHLRLHWLDKLHLLLHLLPGCIAVYLVLSLYFEQTRDFIWNSSVATVLLQVLMICLVQDEFISTRGRLWLHKLDASAEKLLASAEETLQHKLVAAGGSR